MLRNVCQDIDLLNKCLEKVVKSSPESKDSCFYIANSLVTLLIAMITFIREDIDGRSTGELQILFQNQSLTVADNKVWKPIEEQFNTFNSEVSETVSRLEKLSRLSELEDITHLNSTLAALPRLSVRQSPDETASLPCFIYPSSRTFRFFDRTEDIIEMDRYFGNVAHDPNQPFRSIALYGVGGVGKSSIALRYAETRIHRKELDAMFWVAGEKEVSLRQSFSDIAVRLKLPGAQVKDYDQNRTLVLEWFQTTGKASNTCCLLR